MSMHEIRIADPMFFSGPDGDNRILVRGIGTIYGSPHFMVPNESYLVEVIHPFTVDGEEVNQLVVNERHTDSTLDELIKGEGAANIARVKPARLLAAGDEYEPFDMEYWAIGWIRAC
jgi:hypothetical protein